MHKSTRAVIGLVVSSVGLSYLTQRPTEATPAFAKKEGNIPCGYCHVKAEGGGRRNYRGKYYQRNNLSFAGFDDAAEAKAASVDIGPFADTKPASLTPPAPAQPTPAAPTAAAVVSAVAMATTKAHTAMLAYQKNPKDATLKKSYVTALETLSHETLLDQTIPSPKRFTDTQSLAKRVLALDPKNTSAAADLKAANSALKVEKAKGAAPK